MIAETGYRIVTFYVSSGTGNSLRVTNWMQEIARSQGIKSEIHMIDSRIPKQVIPDAADTLVCIGMPTHGFTAPWSVIKFAFRLPSVSKTRAVVVATQGRLHFRHFFIPGLSASATFLIAAILGLKGYHVRGVQSINMPSNWMALHSGQKSEYIGKIIDAARKPSEMFITTILSGKRSWLTPLNILEFLLAIPLLPVSIGYLIYGKLGLAKLFFTNRRCNGCGLCAEYCPNVAIRMKGKKSQRPFWTFHCESCMRCMAFCPEKAIEVHQPSAYLVFKVSLLATFFFLIKFINTSFGVAIPLRDSLWLRIIHYCYYITVWFLFSIFVFWLTQVPLINRLFHYTTLTALYRRYREPGTTLSHLK